MREKVSFILVSVGGVAGLQHLSRAHTHPFARSTVYTPLVNMRFDELFDLLTAQVARIPNSKVSKLLSYELLLIVC